MGRATLSDCEGKISNNEMVVLQEKYSVMLKQDPKASISGNHIKRSWELDSQNEQDLSLHASRQTP